MKFYSYEYLVGQVHAFSWLKAVVVAIVLIGVIVAIVRHNKDRYETKYRELIILGIIDCGNNPWGLSLLGGCA